MPKIRHLFNKLFFITLSQLPHIIPMIIGEIKRHLRDNTTLRVSRSLKDIAYKALQAREELSGTLNREPTVDEIAKKLEMRPEEITEALEAIVEPVSLYEPVFSDNGDSVYLMDQISDNVHTDDSLIENIALKEAFKKLSEREKRIITMRYFDGKTQVEAAEEIGVSQAQVSRIEKSALEAIKKEM